MIADNTISKHHNLTIKEIDIALNADLCISISKDHTIMSLLIWDTIVSRYHFANKSHIHLKRQTKNVMRTDTYRSTIVGLKWPLPLLRDDLLCRAHLAMARIVGRRSIRQIKSLARSGGVVGRDDGHPREPVPWSRARHKFQQSNNISSLGVWVLFASLGWFAGVGRWRVDILILFYAAASIYMADLAADMRECWGRRQSGSEKRARPRGSREYCLRCGTKTRADNVSSRYSVVRIRWWCVCDSY